MSYSNPSVADFKAFFVRDFPYGTDSTTTILDTDIANAYRMTNVNLNESLWENQEEYELAYLYLSAHYLVMNIRASSQGISGQFSWLQQSKSVGSVSESFGIPQRIMDNPILAIFSKTTYGARYLEMVYPRLVGQVFTVEGATTP